MINRDISYYALQGIIGITFAVMLGVWLTEYSTKTFLFIMLGIIGALISVFKPIILLFLFFLFITMEQVSVMPQETLFKVMGLYLGILVLTQISLTKKILLPRSSKAIWILVFGVVAILSFLVSLDPVESQRRMMRLWRLIAMYILIVTFIKSTRALNMGILALVIGGSLSVVLNLFAGIGGLRYVSSISGVRSAGLVGDPNSFAAILLVLMPLSLLLFFRVKSIFMKALTIGLFCVLLMGFFNTFSRGGFIGLSILLIISVFKFDILKKRSNTIKIVTYIMLIAIIGIAIFYPMSEQYIARIETLRNSPLDPDADRSVSGRFENALTALGVFWDHPLLGVGIRAYKSINPLDKVAHNTYLEVLTGMGLLGFIPFMAILFLSWRELKRIQIFWKLRDKKSFIYQSAVALELSLVPYFIAATFLSLDLGEMTWLLITLSSVLWNISLREKERVFYHEERDTYSSGYTTPARS